MGCFALAFAADLSSRYPPVVIARILAGAIDQQVLLFINQILPVKLPHLEIRSELNGVGGAGFFAETAKDAARKVNAEEFRKAPAVFVLGGLERDAIDRTRDRA